MALARITAIGKKKLCQAHAGLMELPKISHMAFGTGGLNDDGSVKLITGNEEALYHEVLKKEIESYELLSDATCRYTARVDKLELINIDITELGLIDTEGDLVVYKSCPHRQKDGDEEMLFSVDEIF